MPAAEGGASTRSPVELLWPGVAADAGRQRLRQTLSTLKQVLGALAKCLRMGYEPWQTTPQGQAMRATYNACVRLVRGDLQRPRRAVHRNGQQIDIYDPLGVQKADMAATQAFEADWNEHGAV